MGLSLTCKGISEYSKNFNEVGCIALGFGCFLSFRLKLAKKIDNKLGLLYKRWLESAMSWMGVENLTNQEFREMKKLAKNVFILLAHSDCDGKLTYKEAKEIYNDIKDLDFKYPITTMYDNREIDLFEAIKDLLYFSWKKRRNIYFI